MGKDQTVVATIRNWKYHPLLLPVLAAVLVAACVYGLQSLRSSDEPFSNENTEAYAYESYGSVEALVQLADTIVVGTVGPTRGRQIEGNPDLGTAIILQEIAVTEVLRNDSLRAGSKIVLSSLDPDRPQNLEQAPLVKGQKVLLMVMQIPLGRTPTIELAGYDVIYGRFGRDHSVFDVAEAGTATSRDPEIQTFLFSDAPQAEPQKQFSFDVDQVRQLVANSPTKPLIWDPDPSADADAK